MKNLAYYQALPYTRKVEGILDEDGAFYWIAWIEEMPDCEAEGDTQGGALCNLNGVFDDYIEAMIEFEELIPPPKNHKFPEEVREAGKLSEIIMESSVVAYGVLATKVLDLHHPPKEESEEIEKSPKPSSAMLPSASYEGRVPVFAGN